MLVPEREQNHRHKIVERAQGDDYLLKRKGQNLAMASQVLLLLFAGLMAYWGQYVWAGRIGAFTIVAVVGIFVTGRILDYKAAKDPEEN